MIETRLFLLSKDLENAIQSFESSLHADLSKYSELETDWIKNAQIQKFEYTIELLWKTIKEFFKTKYEENFSFPVENIKEFFIKRYIDEDVYNTLYDAIKSRNQLSHVYKTETFDLISHRLPDYLKAIKTAYESIRTSSI